MSEKEQPTGAPSETQRSGFVGERRDSAADELSPQAEASERSLSRRVSRETPSAPPSPENKSSSAVLYLLVLFGAAFLMLLLAYFVQRRNNEVLQDNWNLSRGELVEQIAALEEEKQGLEAQTAQLEQQLKQEQENSQEFQMLYDGARNSASHLEYSLLKRGEALELFWQLDRAYTQGQNQRAQELIQLMEAGLLKDFLPNSGERESYDSGGYMDGWPSPAERYQEIYEKLIEP